MKETREKILSTIGLLSIAVFVFFLIAHFPLLGVFMLVLLFGFAVLLSFKKISLKSIILLLLFFAICTPPIRTGSTPYIRPELLLIIIAWVLYIFDAIAAGKTIKIRWSSVHKWFFFFGGLILFSIFFSWANFGLKPAARDFFEIAKLMEYFLIFALAFTLKFEEKDFKRYYLFLLFIFGFSALVGVVQYFNFFPSLNRILIEYFSPTHVEDWTSGKRISGTAGGPNDYGILMTMASLFALTGFLWIKERRRKFLSLGFLLLFGFALILSLSRSSIVAFLGGATFLLFYKYPKKVGARGKIRLLFLILPLLVILTIVILSFAPPNFLVRVNSALGFKTDVSFQTRLQLWSENLKTWQDSPMFGWGPGKDEMTTVVDNEWILLLRRYGIVGVFGFFLLFIKLYSGVGRQQRIKKVGTFENIFSVFPQASILSIVLYMIPSSFYHSLQLMPILMVFLGLVYVDKKSFRKQLAYEKES